MGSAISAIYEIMEEEEYKRKLEDSKAILSKMTPERFIAINDALSENIRRIRKYGVGTETFWLSVNTIEDLLNNLK